MEKQDTRRCILDQAEQLFEHKGFAAVSMREICAACAVTKPTLYYYFADKEALYVATLLRRLAGMREKLALQATQDSMRERLIRLAAHIFQRMRTNVDVMLRDMENITQHHHHEYLGEAFRQELYQPLVEVMRSGIEHGELRNGDPLLYAKVYLGLINAFIETQTPQTIPTMVPRPTADWTPEQRAVFVVDVLLQGIAL